MFMFRSKRNTLVRRLWKARIRGEHEAQRSSEGGGGGGGGASGGGASSGGGGWCGGGVGGGWCGGAPADASTSGLLCRGGDVGGGSPMAVAATAEEESGAASSPPVEGASAHLLHQLRNVLVKRLKEQQLERLLAAVENRGMDDYSGCVLVPRDGCEGGDSGKEEPMEESCAEDEESSSAAAAMDSAGSSPASSPNCCAYLSSHHHHQSSTFHHLQHQHRQHNNPPPVPPQVLCCQIWRWPDLRLPSELKRLPLCKTSKDPVYICCNPYHWSRLCKPESPPPPYCRFAKERLKPEDRAPSEREATAPYGSLTTNGEGEGGEREWCKLAYWELGTRVGRQFSVELPAVNVFSSRHRGDGLCLATLAAHHKPVPSAEPVRRTRSKIGLGVTLSQEPDGVWVYNRSESPIFVNSPTLDDPDLRTLLVYRVPSGHCLKIFDGERRKAGAYSRAAWDPRDGPVDPNSVRISFAKGWGSKYTRQEITSCPCWLEVLLVPCR
ncbi:mothers against decapentaplegic homolog 7 [Ischnura elegans]|uniref:mothers against decapentaplegic homolog 7 n=1 Tax=Ischnura elegans TaxID=197161 RepID=UPI001ED87D9C|nr:mothers against decapentaplegic homolog 7 [Ischnura elegans]